MRTERDADRNRLINLENTTSREIDELNKQLANKRHDFKRLQQENMVAQERYANCLQDYEQAKKEKSRQNIYIQEIGNELDAVKISREELTKETNMLSDSLSRAVLNNKSLEDRIVILVKEKENLDTLIAKVATAYPCREMTTLINDLTYLNEDIIEAERKKLKFAQELELKNLTSEQEENQKSVRSGKKELIETVARQIEELNIRRQKKEEEFDRIQLREKQKYEQNFERDVKIEQLTEDLNLAKEQSRRKHDELGNSMHQSRNLDEEKFDRSSFRRKSMRTNKSGVSESDHNVSGGFNKTSPYKFEKHKANSKGLTRL